MKLTNAPLGFTSFADAEKPAFLDSTLAIYEFAPFGRQ
jgi:hypothetical protein